MNFVNKECTQQSNGYDCGIHVIYNTERMAEYAHNNGELTTCDMQVKINPTAKRREILSIIQSLSHN